MTDTDTAPIARPAHSAAKRPFVPRMVRLLAIPIIVFWALLAVITNTFVPKIEDVAEELERALLLAVPRITVTIIAVAFVSTVAALVVSGFVAATGVCLLVGLRLSLRLRNLRSRLGPRTLENLVKLAAIEPHATTLRAVVDLDTVAFAHQQRGSVGGAVHVP